MNYSRAALRKLAPLAGLHEWLKGANEWGSITRQEAVSMVPPLLLDVQPQHLVLDMCAAPGSKTFQLLEALHAGCEASAPPLGCVLANDSDLQRCNLLTHQTKRAASPALLVTNHDATTLPGPRSPGGAPIRFDRVLADVPCSGDGTLRKAPEIWRKWVPGLATGLHPLQLAIAKRGAQLLKPGGRMVYSTCSLNPCENEAVVAALLRWGGGCLRLLDCSASLPSLRRRPGLSSWVVWDKAGPRDTAAAGDFKQKDLAHTLFCVPPVDASEEELLQLTRCMRILPHDADTGAFFVAVLEKTGELPAAAGDASAADAERNAAAQPPPLPPPAEEVSPPPSDAPVSAAAAAAAASAAAAAQPEGAAPAPAAPHPPKAEEGTAAAAAAAAAGGGGAPAAVVGAKHPRGPAGPRLNPRVPTDPVVAVTDAALVSTITNFYGLGPGLPLAGALFMRAEDGARPKRLYAVAPGASSLLSDPRRRLKVMSAGVKLFERGHDASSSNNGGGTGGTGGSGDGSTASACPYRIAQEGLRWVLPHASAQKAAISLEQLARLVQQRVLFFAQPDRSKAASAAARGGGAAAAAAAAAAAEATGAVAGEAGEAAEPLPPAEEAAPAPTPHDAALFDAETCASLAPMRTGCVILIPALPPSLSAGVGAPCPEDLAVVAWKGAVSLALLVAKAESGQLLTKLQGLLRKAGEAAAAAAAGNGGAQ